MQTAPQTLQGPEKAAGENVGGRRDKEASDDALLLTPSSRTQKAVYAPETQATMKKGYNDVPYLQHGCEGACGNQ